MDPKGIGDVAPQAGHGRPAENALDYDAFLLPLEDISTTFSDIDFLDFYDDPEVTEAPPSSSAEFPYLSPDGENPDVYDPPLISDDTGQFDAPMARIDPVPFLSAQFYSFSKASHSLMTTCLIEGRLPKPEEIKAVSEPSVLEKWSIVWRDRSEETAYVTAWKRIQDKLTIYAGNPPDTPIGNDNPFICFKNNFSLFVSHVDQWQDIVMAFHVNGDSKHLGPRETISRVKKVWSVGCKFYGIPENFIRTCVDACPVCLDQLSGGNVQRSRKHRFEYTDTFELPAKEVVVKLKQLELEHKAKLSIRQKYLKYNPFMAEVKDYTCQKAGDPGSSKRSRALKRGPYASKRCGCQFRVRVTVPISNYNKEEKTYAYNQEGTAVFMIYREDSAHEADPIPEPVTDNSVIGDEEVQNPFQ